MSRLNISRKYIFKYVMAIVAFNKNVIFYQAQKNIFFYRTKFFYFSVQKNQILKALSKINITIPITYEFAGKTYHKCYLHITKYPQRSVQSVLKVKFKYFFNIPIYEWKIVLYTIKDQVLWVNKKQKILKRFQIKQWIIIYVSHKNNKTSLMCD